MRAILTWSLGATASITVHAAVGLLLVLLFSPRPVEQQPSARARIQMTTLSVQAEIATETAPDARTAREARPEANAAGLGAVPESRSKSLLLASTSSQPVAPSGTLATPAPPSFLEALPLSTTGQIVPPLDAPGAQLERIETAPVLVGAPERPAARTRLAELGLETVPLTETTPAPTRLAARAKVDQRAAVPARLDPVVLNGREPGGILSTAVVPAGADLASLTPSPVALRPAVPVVGTVSLAAPEPSRLSGLAVAAEAAPPRVLTSQPTAVLLAWSGDLFLELREQTVEAAAALRVADPETDGQTLRDALTQRLAEVACARAQTSYDPTSGVLELLGHVRNDADRDILVTRLEEELQGAIPVVDRLKRLGEPQCVVLTRLANLPLPQSVEQFTNPLILGQDLQARVYSFDDGEAMRFELGGADYDAWVYLDYFGSDGRVLHLLPNATIPPVRLRAQAPLVFGGGGPDDIARGRIELRVSPPFGQDIAVAMVVNRPLFDAPREMVEDGETYLADLARRVRELREEDEDFRGEWVYLFVETGPRGAAGIAVD